MCGITGFIQYRGGAQEDIARRCQAMADTIIHRGPDAEAFGSIRRFHSRLAIVGCPSLPSQPITSTRF